MKRNWKLLLILTGSALVGATAIAVASDLIKTRISDVVPASIMRANDDADQCPPNACSVVFKSTAPGEASQIVELR
jgi:hypothetical protein